MSLAETLLQTHPEKFGLWPSVWKLLRLRWRVRVNTFKRSSRKSKIGTILLAVLLVAAMVGLFLLSRLVLNLLLNPALAQYVDPAQFINAIPTLILTAAFLITLMTNFSVLLQSLYLSHDMDFLVTSPIPMRAVFLAKLVEAILPTFGLFCAFSIPVLFGLGASSHYSFIYYPLLIVFLILLALAAGGLASILVMGVVRVVPARRVAEVLGFFGAIASVLCGQSGNIIRQFNIQRNDIGAALTAFTGMNNPWFPLSWAGRGLVAVGSGEWLPGAALSLLTLAMGCVLFGGTLFLAEHLYYSGWASMQGSSRKKRAKNRVARSGPVSATFQTTPGNAAERSIAGAAGKKPKRSWIPSAVRGVIVKDLYLLRRDTRNLAQLITPLV
ncbi:MAG TPA: hypothetical protein VHO48_08960, partial [Anaerolineaceae bacterium]|nr:hypothetical protein [Anaerolineaceae bacterium]